MVRIARETSWHQSISLIGMRMSSDVWVVLRVAQGIELELVDAVRQEINELTDSAFIAMGGQQDKFFEEKGDSTNSLWKTRANQSCVYISSSIRCLVWLATNAEQSLLLQAVLISWCIKTVGIIIQSVYSFASLGGNCGSDSLVVRTIIYVWMEAGDVIIFNGLVWHSGLSNDIDSCVVFMYFDYEPFFITEEILLADPNADPSRFGFTKIYSKEKWQQFSVYAESDQKLLNIQDLSDIRAAPTAILHALIPHDQWTLDK